jgi:hypothetical protein
MFGQKTFAVYAKPDEDDPLTTTVFVKEGFSFLAYIFTFFWALYYKIWWLVVFCFVFQVGKQFMIEYGMLSEQSDIIISMAYMVLIGFQAQDWYGKDLERKGYSLIGIVMARNLDDARQRFFDKYISHARRSTDTPTNMSLAS